eukprot:m.35732 g.35732  ORF g.35732 m.35732 type:complete len:233 (+) comp10040_c0_seq1:63-761(+)
MEGEDDEVVVEERVSGTISEVDTSLDTLDESVWTTVKRDIVQLLGKFSQVLLPRNSSRKDILKDWDLYGPMILTITLAFLLRESAPDNEKGQVFTGVFFILCAGSAVITLNNQLLGGTMSIFQGMCVLGYCLLPLIVACVVLRLVSYVTTHLAIRIVVVAFALAWCIKASLGFVAKSSPSSRRALVVYPIVLYYVFIAWLVLNDVPTTSTSPSTTSIPTTTTTTSTTINASS